MPLHCSSRSSRVRACERRGSWFHEMGHPTSRLRRRGVIIPVRTTLHPAAMIPSSFVCGGTIPLRSSSEPRWNTCRPDSASTRSRPVWGGFSRRSEAGCSRPTFAGSKAAPSPMTLRLPRTIDHLSGKRKNRDRDNHSTTISERPVVRSAQCGDVAINEFRLPSLRSRECCGETVPNVFQKGP